MKLTEKYLRKVIRRVILENEDRRFEYINDSNLRWALSSYEDSFSRTKGDLDKFIKEMYNSKFGEIEMFTQYLGQDYVFLTSDKNLASAIKLADVHVCNNNLLPYLLDKIGR